MKSISFDFFKFFLEFFYFSLNFLFSFFLIFLRFFFLRILFFPSDFHAIGKTRNSTVPQFSFKCSPSTRHHRFFCAFPSYFMVFVNILSGLLTILKNRCAIGAECLKAWALARWKLRIRNFKVEKMGWLRFRELKLNENWAKPSIFMRRPDSEFNSSPKLNADCEIWHFSDLFWSSLTFTVRTSLYSFRFAPPLWLRYWWPSKLWVSINFNFFLKLLKTKCFILDNCSICKFHWKQSIESGNPYKVLQSLIAFVVWTYLFYFFCDCGEEVGGRFEGICDTIYDCPWHEMPIKLRKCLIIMMRISQKPITREGTNILYDRKQFAKVRLIEAISFEIKKIEKTNFF